MRPIASPIICVRPKRSSSPLSLAMSAPISGTAAISSPVSELESRTSAVEIMSQGTPISMIVYKSSGRQRRRRSGSSFR